MKKIDGKQNELEFVKYLNNKKIKEVNLLFYDLIKSIFCDVSDEDYIKSYLNSQPQKADFFIKINGVIKRISLKVGDKNSVHVDPISEFVHFLIENKVEREIVIAFLKYHYADGTTNGSGDKRLTIADYKKEHQEEIDKINISLNNDDLIEKAISRFLIRGRNSNDDIDALVYGTTDDFLWLSKNEIKEIVINKKDDYSTGVHIGPLSIQPQSRNLKFSPQLEHYRFCVQIKWFNLCDHIIEYKNNSLNKKVMDNDKISVLR